MAKQGAGTKVLPNALWRNSMCEACLSPPRTRKNVLPFGAIRAHHWELNAPVCQAGEH